MSESTQAAWPEGVIVRYLTVGGATVDLAVRSGYFGVEHPTEHFVACSGCGETCSVEWGWDAWHEDFGTGPQPNFDPTGLSVLPKAREWGQAHAEYCRALPRPEAGVAA
ncbi:hypothetical protein [Streptomyces albus]|uniref:hypothetical protein n=1 Tax=Streptomyces albus TaxID=1888 RepID=UPI0034109AD6